MSMDLNISFFQWISKGAGHHPFWDHVAIFFSKDGPYVLVLAFVVAWFLIRDERKPTLLEAIEAAVAGLLLNQLIGLFYFHPRPYMVGLCTPLIPHGPENSFPSDHATVLFGASIYLLLFGGRLYFGASLLGLAFVTAWGRVYSGIHFPLDMLGSLGVGLLSAFLVSSVTSVLDPLNEFLIRAWQVSRKYVRAILSNKGQPWRKG